jgi:hypothetical protein
LVLFFGTKTKTKFKSNPEKMMVVIGFFGNKAPKNVMVENGLSWSRIASQWMITMNTRPKTSSHSSKSYTDPICMEDDKSDTAKQVPRMIVLSRMSLTTLPLNKTSRTFTLKMISPLK